MKLAHTNPFVAYRNVLDRDSLKHVRPVCPNTAPSFKTRRPLTRLVARWHVCPETSRLECLWSLERVACDDQLCRSKARERRYGPARHRRSPNTLMKSHLTAVSRLRNRHRTYPQLCSETIRRGASRCPLWVISGHLQRKTECPLYPRKRTCAVH
jgi:hypothetical protein